MVGDKHHGLEEVAVRHALQLRRKVFSLREAVLLCDRRHMVHAEVPRVCDDA